MFSPNYIFNTQLRADVCQKCEDLCQLDMRAVSEEQKEATLQSSSDHIRFSSAERAIYGECSERASAELASYQFVTAPPYLPCSHALAEYALYVRFCTSGQCPTYSKASRANLFLDAQEGAIVLCVQCSYPKADLLSHR